MKITLIRPSMNGKIAADALQPLAFAILAGLTPPDVDLDFFDERIESLPKHLNTDLVVLSVETFSASRAYRIADTYRAQGLKVLMGGYHPTFMPHEALEHADSVIIGEAEGIWPQVLDDLKTKELKTIYRLAQRPDIHNTVFDRSLFADKKYAPVLPVQFGRGCRFACDFCSIHAFYGSEIRQRNVDAVRNEIQNLQGKTLFLVDDNLFADRNAAISLLRAITPLRVKWATQASIDIASDPEMLKLMRDSGCIAVLIGFESMDRRNLAQMKKAVNLQNFGYASAVKTLQSYGIMVYGTFVFGYDYDTPDTIKRALDFALENKLFLANFNTLMPMPGTALYKRFQHENRLIYDKWWLSPDFRYGQAMFRPLGMSPEALTDACMDARVQFNRYSSIASRAMEFRSNSANPRNLGFFLAANLISRKEIYEKQGTILGEQEELYAHRIG